MFIEDLKGVIDKKDVSGEGMWLTRGSIVIQLPSPVLLALNACFKSNILAEISAAKQQNNFTLAYNTISSFSELDVTKAEKQLVYLQLHLQWVLSAEDSIRASQLLGRGIGLTYEQEVSIMLLPGACLIHSIRSLCVLSWQHRTMRASTL